ncbi:MAG: tetratricopeptide repeat protein [Candidatus Zixiibacteriota bacterium]|nr:MAG: tetratricopeptide repeat protein [candidate division Zixibacteria bacterium]
MFGRALILVMALILLGHGLLAQEGRSDGSRQDSLLIGRRDQATQTKLRVVRQLLAGKNFHGAAAMLESLYEQQPDHDIVLNLLQTCYRQLKLHGKLETLTRRRLEKSPDNLSFKLTLAETLAQQSRIDEALLVYEDAIEGLSGRDRNRYLIVIRSLIGQDFEPRALSLIDTTRIVFADSTLFAVHRGMILERTRKYKEAAYEYLPLLMQDTTQEAGNAERRILALLDFAESAPVVEEILVETIGRAESGRALQLLTTHFLKSGRFDVAYDYALRQDSLSEGNGQSLMRYVRQCRDHRAYHEVIRMSQHLMERYPQSPFMADAMSGYAFALTQVGRPEDAVKEYRRVVEQFEGTPSASEAWYQIGSIYLNQLNKPEQALAYYDSLVTLSPRGQGFLNARKAIPQCYLRMGNLDKARDELELLKTANLNEESLEELEFNLALISFYGKVFDTAEVALRRLMVEYPKGYYVNDALQLILLISRAEGNDTLLYDYSSALYFAHRLMSDSAKASYLRLAEADDRVLADVALLRLAELELADADTTESINTIEKLGEMFPESYYVPFGLLIKADVLAAWEDGVDEAREIYSRLLMDYSDYPFIGDVRRRLRVLEPGSGPS